MVVLILLMGGIIVFGALCFATVGFVVGGTLGAIVGLLVRHLRANRGHDAAPRWDESNTDSLTDSELRDLRAERRREGRRSTSGVGAAAAGFGLGGLVGAVAALCLSCVYFVGDRDGPPHGYPDRAAYRKAEMEHRAKALDPLIAALEKYKAEKGKYPADPRELITGGDLNEFPAATTNDHQGASGRISSPSYSYHSSPNGDQFALTVTCGFSEDKRGLMGIHIEKWVYDSRTPGWSPGQQPDGWSGGSLSPPEKKDPKGGPATKKQ